MTNRTKKLCPGSRSRVAVSVECLVEKRTECPFCNRSVKVAATLYGTMAADGSLLAILARHPL